MDEPTLEQLLASLGPGNHEPPAGYRSREEWALYWGRPLSAVGKVLRAAHTAGRLLCERRESTGVDGRRCQTPVYSFVVE